MKKFVFVCCLLCSVFSSSALFALTTFTGEGENANFLFTVIEGRDNEVSIKAAVESHASITGALSIPSSVKHGNQEYTVTRIDSGGFSNVRISSLEIPATIEEIGYNAFRQITTSFTLSLAEGLQTIGNRAFCQSTGLYGNLVIPTSVELIDQHAFYNVNADKSLPQLTSITFSSPTPPVLGNIAALQNSDGTHLVDGIHIPCDASDVYRTDANWKNFLTIKDCPEDQITEVVIGGIMYRYVSETTAKVVGGWNYGPDLTFEETVSIRGISLTVTEIDTCAFQGKTDITSITIPASIQAIDSGAFRDIKKTPFTLNLENATNLKRIENRAFCQSSGLAGSTLVIPSSVEFIGDYAFGYTGLGQVRVEATTPPTLEGDNNFAGLFELIEIPCKYGEIYEANSKWQDLGVHDPCDENQFHDDSFWYVVTDADNFEVRLFGFYGGVPATFEIPKQVSHNEKTYTITSLEDHLLQNNMTISTLLVPSTVKIIPENAFYGCTSLRKATIEEGVQTISLRAFAHCTSLQELTIPASVTTIEPYAFHSCSSVTRLTFESFAPPTVGSMAFYNWANIESIHIPCGSESDYRGISPLSEYFGKYVSDCFPLVLHEGEYLEQEGYVSSISLRRTFPMNQWVPLYLPFDVDSVLVWDPDYEEYFDINHPYESGVGGYFYLQVLNQTSLSSESTPIKFEPTSTLEGHHLYIIQFVDNLGSDYFRDKEIIFMSKKGEFPLRKDETSPASLEPDYRFRPNTTYFAQHPSDIAYFFTASTNPDGTVSYGFAKVYNPTLLPFTYCIVPSESILATPSITPAMFSMRIFGETNQDDDITTSISSVSEEDGIRYQREGNRLVLQTNGKPCQIYSADGMLLYSADGKIEEVSLELSAGVYILYSEGNSQSYKISL